MVFVGDVVEMGAVGGSRNFREERCNGFWLDPRDVRLL